MLIPTTLALLCLGLIAYAAVTERSARLWEAHYRAQVARSERLKRERDSLKLKCADQDVEIRTLRARLEVACEAHDARVSRGRKRG